MAAALRAASSRTRSVNRSGGAAASQTRRTNAATSPSSAETPLMLAARAGNAQACAVLLQRGADKTLLDERGRTAQDFASARAGDGAVEAGRRSCRRGGSQPRWGQKGRGADKGVRKSAAEQQEAQAAQEVDVTSSVPPPQPQRKQARACELVLIPLGDDAREEVGIDAYYE